MREYDGGGPPLDSKSGYSIHQDSSDPVDDNSTLMLVSADQHIVMGLETAIEGEHHLFLAARDGAKALAQANICWPDIVFIDTSLPGMDWFEFFLRLKLLAPHKFLAAMIIRTPEETASVFRRDVNGASMFSKGSRAGLELAFQKPVDPQELRVGVHRVLQHRRQLKTSPELVDVEMEMRKAAKWEDTLREIFLEHTGRNFRRAK